jgi:hypothetical protein
MLFNRNVTKSERRRRWMRVWMKAARKGRKVGGGRFTGGGDRGANRWLLFLFWLWLLLCLCFGFGFGFGFGLGLGWAVIGIGQTSSIQIRVQWVILVHGAQY